QEADVKPRFLTGAAPNLALLSADDAATAESILARKRGIEKKTAAEHKAPLRFKFLGERQIVRYPERIPGGWSLRSSVFRGWSLGTRTSNQTA
ncbi:MAG TPA: hypothetical protein PLY87_09940, partial [Planctomycetaceae bacterium]|nr:hypothetical protein [Planctomycetaceae bacterium]